MPTDRKRRRLLQSIAGGGLLGGSLSTLLRDALADELKPMPTGLHRISGQVTVNGQPARTGQAVGNGDRIVTAPDSEAIYVIGQDAYLQRGGSDVSFAGDAARGIVRIVSGRILSVFGKGNKLLEVPTATIGIRGTGCYIEAEPAQVYFCLCYGSAEVRPKADPQRVELIETEHHDHPIAIHSDARMPLMTPAKVVNHTDLELTLLENLVGRWPPFRGRGDDRY